MIRHIVILYLFSFVGAIASSRVFLEESGAWFQSPKGREVTSRILSLQSNEGSSPKNKDLSRVEFAGDVRCRNAVLPDLDHILKARYSHGVDCIIKCQILANDIRSVWCAQHDEITFAPAPARKSELVSLGGSESADILMFRMSFEEPSQEVIRSVTGGVSWFEVAQITGLRSTEIGGETNVVKDPSVPAVWARDEPGEIEVERRNGDAWYGNWGENGTKAHAKWRHR